MCCWLVFKFKQSLPFPVLFCQINHGRYPHIPVSHSTHAASSLSRAEGLWEPRHAGPSRPSGPSRGGDRPSEAGLGGFPPLSQTTLCNQPSVIYCSVHLESLMFIIVFSTLCIWDYSLRPGRYRLNVRGHKMLNKRGRKKKNMFLLQKLCLFSLTSLSFVLVDSFTSSGTSLCS